LDIPQLDESKIPEDANTADKRRWLCEGEIISHLAVSTWDLVSYWFDWDEIEIVWVENVARNWTFNYQLSWDKAESLNFQCSVWVEDWKVSLFLPHL
jgi:hypothetical protein